MTSSTRALLLACAAAAASACGGGSETDARLNVLLVVIDTARADKLGSYGHDGGLTPRIDELAASGARFERAAAHAPWTLPSTASLLTSLHPQEHGAGGSLDLSPLAEGQPPIIGFRALPEDVDTVTEVFRDAGWRTGAVVNVDFLDEGFGLTQGIDDVDARWYESNAEVRSATETTDQALAWLAERADAGEPFFLLAHYFDAHAVYAPPDEYRRAFAAPQDRESDSFVFGTRAHMLMLRSARLELEPAILERAERLYEAELAYVDAEVGRLVDGLDALGLGGDTIVVLTADHGEEFLDHGGFEHGHTLYDELVRVPLIVRLPGLVSPGTVIESSAGLVDVAPTVCELAGIASPPAFAGHSLAPALRGEAQPSRPLLAHGNFWGEPLTSWTSGRWKLIVTPSASDERVELYDLVADPLERNDLASSDPERVQALRAELAAVTAHLAARAGGEAVQLDEAMRRRLQALGYLGGEEDGDAGPDVDSDGDGD